MTQRDIMMQYVLTRMFSISASQGVSLSRESGYAVLRRQMVHLSPLQLALAALAVVGAVFAGVCLMSEAALYRVIAWFS